MARTARATSSGWPQRRIGVMPLGNQLVVLFVNRAGHVGVDDAGGRFQRREIPSSASRSAKSQVIIDIAALLMQ